MLEPETRDSCHQVQLRRPRVAELDRARAKLAVLHVEVLTVHPLGDGVVHVERHPRGVGAPGQDGLAERKPLQLGNARLDDEAPARRQMCRRVLEAGDLAVLRGQVEDRVEDEVDEREVAVHARRGHVAARASIRSAPGFSRRRASMASELSMPATRTPRSASGSAIRPVPIANSTAAPSPASSASRSTAGPSTRGSNMLAERSSYDAATRSPK